METVLDSPWQMPAEEAQDKGLFERAALALQARNIRGFAQLGAAEFGALLLAAETPGDLDARIEEVIDNPELWHLALMLNMSYSTLFSLSGDTGASLLHAAASEPNPLMRLSTLLGGHKAEALREAGRLNQGIALLQLQYLNAVPLARVWAWARSPLAFLTDIRFPGLLASMLLDGARAYACFFALYQLLQTGQPPAPWLGEGLVERWIGGMRSYLRLLASFPGASVPADLVPAGERVDIEAAFQQAARAAQRMEAFVKEAADSGLSIYPPDPPFAHDD